jgi:hypothetical protein
VLLGHTIIIENGVNNSNLYDLPVSIFEFSMMIFDDSAMSIPSVFGLSFGAIMCRSEMCEP